MGNNEQVIEIQVPSTDHGKSTRSLEPHVLDSSQEPTLAARGTLDRVQMHKLNARKAIAI